MKIPDNQLLKSFLEHDENKRILDHYCKNPSKHNKEQLDNAFKRFYFKIRSLSYFSKVLPFEAVKFDKKIKKYKDYHLMIIDRPLNRDYDTSDNTLIDYLEDTSTNLKNVHSTKLQDHINDLDIETALNYLTPKQKNILYYSFVMEFKDTEIAEMLKVSQQNISKTKKRALTKIRRELDVG